MLDHKTIPFSKVWMRTSLAFLLLASILGTIMRYMAVGEIHFLSYRHVLHSHSHVALLGWSYMIVTGSMIFLVLKSNNKVYRHIFKINVISTVGMFAFFIYQGYGAYSIAFSTLFLVSVYWFGYRFLKDVRSEQDENHVRLYRWSIYWLLISTLGLWGIAPVSILLGKLHPLYNMSIQFFLHFQFNGWLTFGMLGLIVFVFQGDTPISKIGFFCLILSIPLTYFLGINTLAEVVVINYVNLTGAVFFAVGLYLVLRSIPEIKKCFKPATWDDWLLLIGIMSLILKTLLQLVLAVPLWTSAILSVRNYVIGFVHLLMLGTITLTVVSLLIKQGFLPSNTLSRLGWMGFMLAFILTEVILFSRAFSFWHSNQIMYDQSLFVASCLFPVSLIMILIATFQRRYRS